jgi:hypothetical protein
MYRHVLSLCLGLSPFSVVAKNLPEAPLGCAEQVSSLGFCTQVTVPPRGPIQLSFFAVVETSDYPDADKLLARYQNFAAWPAYREISGSNAILFNRSEALAPISGQDGRILYPHYYHYRIRTAIGYQKIRALNLNEFVTPAPGAEKTIAYTMPSDGSQTVPEGEAPLVGAEGLKFQSGRVHSVDCAERPRDYCLPTQRLLIYEIEAIPSIDILPKVAASAMRSAIEAILVGMVAPPDLALPKAKTCQLTDDTDFSDFR